jgi:hypothetical protein
MPTPKWIDDAALDERGAKWLAECWDKIRECGETDRGSVVISPAGCRALLKQREEHGRQKS